MPQRASLRFTWDSVLFLAVSFLTLFARFRSVSFLLGSFQDDFFYYLKVAENIASTGVSTFNGMYLTNGYHPLWMAVLVVLHTFLHGTAFFIALQIVSFAATASTYVLLLRSLRLLLPDAQARAGAFIVGVEALMLIRYGMEVTLTLPLALLLLFLLLRDGVPQTFRRGAWLGFIASLVVLSRLDSAILLAMITLTLLAPRLEQTIFPTVAIGFVCGIAPLLTMYAAVNIHTFHVLTPVSGLAKQTKLGYMPSTQVWRSLLPDNRMRAILLLPELLVIATSLPLLFSHRFTSGRPQLHRAVLGVLLLFPIVHLSVLSILSDWAIWPWYFYSITLASVAGFVLLAQRLPAQWTVGLVSVYGCALIVYATVYAIKGPNSLSIFESSRKVAIYMDMHPGIYLMGDQAGTTAYLSRQPVIQAEGLVMDREFLMHMRHGDSLRTIVQAYHARYYTVISPPERQGCFDLHEPSNAGPASPKMHGSICHAPLATFYREADQAPIRIFEADWIR